MIWFFFLFLFFLVFFFFWIFFLTFSYFFFFFSVLIRMGYSTTVSPTQCQYTCSRGLLDSQLTTVQVHTRKSTLLSSTHWLRIGLHISLSHDRRKQTVKQNPGWAFSLSLLFSLVCPYHSNYHERALRIERLLHWLPGSPKTIRVEISSKSFVTPSKYSPSDYFTPSGHFGLQFNTLALFPNGALFRGI